MLNSFTYAIRGLTNDLQVWFREFKSNVASCELLVDGCECVHLKLR